MSYELRACASCKRPETLVSKFDFLNYMRASKDEALSRSMANQVSYDILRTFPPSAEELRAKFAAMSDEEKQSYKDARDTLEQRYQQERADGVPVPDEAELAARRQSFANYRHEGLLQETTQLTRLDTAIQQATCQAASMNCDAVREAQGLNAWACPKAELANPARALLRQFLDEKLQHLRDRPH